MNKKSMLFLVSILLLATMLLGACQPQTAVQTVEVEKEKVVEKTVVVEVEKENPLAKYKMAVILPGVITDTDYNTIGYLAATEVQNEMGIPFAYSESVPVPDVERVEREYIDQGYNILFVHGGQFLNQTLEVAAQFPDVIFVCEGDDPVENAPANYWHIDRNFHEVYYAIGYLAANVTKTGKIGYLSGLTMPFTFQEAHAIQQALKDHNLNPEIKMLWAGDFNDPTKARQLADTMIADNVDVIMGSLNLGMFGIFEAAKAASTDTKTVYVTAKYTDKSQFAPKNYLSSSLYDWATPLKNIIKKATEGVTGGYYPMGFGDGFDAQLPVMNVSEEINAEVVKIVDDIKSGKIVVVKDSTPID